MIRFSCFMVVVALFFSFQASSAQTINQPITGQSFSGEITINAAPNQVWEVLIDLDQLTEILDYEYVDGAKKLSKIGDEAQVKVWGEAASFMLVRANRSQELRFNLDPANGSYICACRWKLSKLKNGTKVWFEERYTESGSQTKEDQCNPVCLSSH